MADFSAEITAVAHIATTAVTATATHAINMIAAKQ